MTTVTRIQPKITVVQFENPAAQRKRRVAAYARVSTDSEEQLTSYAAQVDFYTGHIKNNSEWEFVNVYTDEAVSATDTKHRDGFNQMVSDALSGKIDLIITKSVSRFARNTVDSLNTIRRLKEHSVEVYFEKENIYTFDGKGEVMLTIMSSLAQEESRSISENVKWGKRKKAAEGKVSMAYGQFLGYEKGGDGKPCIVESEAETVRLIYKMFLQGNSINVIAKHLTGSGIPTPARKKQWNISTIESILQNEKYKGDAILQKTFVVDFLTKKKKVNEGEVPQYYVENSHPAIIPPDVFDMAQREMAKRKENGRSRSGLGCFSSRIICGECGGFYGSKVWHSTSKYRRTIWQCNHKFTNGEKCKTPHVYEDELKNIFVEAFNAAVAAPEKITADCIKAVDTLTDVTALDSECGELLREMEVVGELIKKCVEENARVAQDQNEYRKRYGALTARYDALKKRLNSITAKRQKLAQRRSDAPCLTDMTGGQDIMTAFDEDVWCAVVEQVSIGADLSATVRFKDGREITVHRKL